MSASTVADLRHIEIQFLTLAQQRRRDDWAVAKVTIRGALGTYGGHTIHDYAQRGRLTVQAAPARILHEATKRQILQRYYQLGVGDRYAEERAAYGIWEVAPCSDGRAPNGPKEYMIHRVCGMADPQSTYHRYAASSLAEALTLAEREDGGQATCRYGIMAADYPEAREAGIAFFAADGLLI